MTAWPMVELGNVAELRGGATPRRDNATYWGGDIPWLTPTDLPARGAGIADVDDTADSITDAGLASCSARVLPPLTVMFSSRASIGKIGIATAPLTTNQGFINLIPHRGLESRYLAWCLHFHADRIADLAGSTTFKEVSKSTLKRFRIPFPSLSEQRRIVEVLDQADSLRHLRAEAETKADRILPALLVRALGSPANWGSDPSCCPLGEFVDPMSGATPSKKTERFWSGDVPWVSPKDMKRDFLSESQDHVSQAALDETNLSLVKQGNTLIVVRGMILARDIPVAINRNPVTINQDMKALIPKTKEITGAYIWATLRLAKQKLQMLVRTAGHGTRKLDTPDLMQFPIPLPNPGRLKQVASLVEHHRLMIERRQNSKRLLDRVFAITLNKAFDGSLTASWRDRHVEEIFREMKRSERAAADAVP